MLIKPIFIICIHRSGSTLLRNIIDANSKVAMATDEMHISSPYHKTFENFYADYDLYNDKEIDKFCEFIFSGSAKGTFWKDYKSIGVNKTEICNKIRKSDRSLKSIIEILLYEYMKLRKKKRVGVKYPLHPGKVDLLKKWFPDSKIIFLTRDIRAVIASKLNDEATKIRKKKFRIFSFIIHYATMIFFIFDFIWYSRIIQKNNLTSILVKYEEIIMNPENKIKEICEFLEIPFENRMLHTTGKPSSHSGEIKYGLDSSRINKWKTVMNKFDKFIINNICGRAMRRIGY